jgi:hypothetical protein
MASLISWLDFSESDRRRAMEVIELFRDKSTVDELGIGTVRDAIADILFPGTSVIHTRARYFLFIPWIYLRLEAKRVSSSEVAGKARTAELDLMEFLRDSDDSDGTIGVRAGRSLKILPSAIYWQALHRLGIRRYAGTRDQYHRSLDRWYAAPGRSIENADGEPMDGGRRWNWDPRLPKAPAGFPNSAVMSIRRPEAEYLRDRIKYAAAGSLYAELLEAKAAPMQSPAPWAYEGLDGLPTQLRNQVNHARLFSEIMAGAPLLYNAMLAKEANNDDFLADHRGRLKAWADRITSIESEIASWNRGEFWRFVTSQGGMIPLQTRLFVERWSDIASAGSLKTIERNTAARALIADRERYLKRGQARLGNDRALDLWQGDSGTRPLTYRWEITCTTLSDIFEGLEAQHDA